MCTLHKGGSVLLLPVGEADSIFRQTKKSLLHTEERSPDALCRGELLLLYTERRVHLFYTRHRVSPCYMYRRQTPSLYKVALSSLHIREGVPLLCVEGGLLFIRSISCLLYTEARVSLLLLYATERVSSPHGGEIVLLLYEEEADSFPVQKRECLL